MTRKLSLIAVVGFFVLAWVGSASAFPVCLGLSNFGSKFKLEVTQFGPFFQLTGSERVFDDRAVSGTAFPGENNTIRVGFLQVSNSGVNVTDIIWNASLASGSLSGPYTAYRPTFGDNISGTMSSIPCTGVLGSDGLPDPTAP